MTQQSHLGPTCDERGKFHMWQTTEHGHDICLDCKLTRPTPEPIALNAKALADAAHVVGTLIDWTDEPGLEELTDMARKVVRAYLSAEPIWRCKICGGVVDLTGAEKPTAHVGAGRHNT